MRDRNEKNIDYYTMLRQGIVYETNKYRKTIDTTNRIHYIGKQHNLCVMCFVFTFSIECSFDELINFEMFPSNVYIWSDSSAKCYIYINCCTYFVFVVLLSVPECMYECYSIFRSSVLLCATRSSSPKIRHQQINVHIVLAYNSIYFLSVTTIHRLNCKYNVCLCMQTAKLQTHDKSERNLCGMHWKMEFHRWFPSCFEKSPRIN